MKYLVLYASLTGNTEKVAQAIYEALPEEKVIKKIGSEVNINEYDLIFLGYWADKGTCDPKTKAIFEAIHNKKIALFATMGASEHGDYGKNISNHVADILPKDNTIIGTFICQGKLAKELKPRYEALLEKNPKDEDVIKQLDNFEQSQSHPDEKDLEDAKTFAKSML
ncbi:MAG: flavodoxin family protein BilS [Cellulosilyticaceae bacterium]